jgi:hypothetical protein
MELAVDAVQEGFARGLGRGDPLRRAAADGRAEPRAANPRTCSRRASLTDATVSDAGSVIISFVRESSASQAKHVNLDDLAVTARHKPRGWARAHPRPTPG